jgi:L-lactate utilization protein LutC
MDRAEFLERVRVALAQGGTGPALPDSYPATPASGDGAAPIDRFVAELAKASAVATVVSRDGLAGAVAEAIRSTESVQSGEPAPSAPRVVIAADVEPWRPEVDRGLEEAGVEVLTPEPGGWRDAARVADWGITSARVGVASTGSVLLVPGADSPRVVSLLPGAHLVILPVDRLVGGLDEAMPFIASSANGSSSAVLVTGPSRTTDIEMTTVFGVHGPRAVRVLLVD